MDSSPTADGGGVDAGFDATRGSDGGTAPDAGAPGADAASPGDDGPGGTPLDATGSDDASPVGDDATTGNDGSGGDDASLWGTPVDGGPPWTGPKVAGTVTVTRGMKVGRVVPGFAGLSYEKSHMTDSFFTANNAALIALCKLLGPSLVRIGGGTVDTTQWMATAPTNPPATIGTSIGQADVDDLAAFLGATGWKTIYGVNMKATTAASAAAEAKYAAGALKDSLYAFEIGNEIDHYGLTYAAVKTNWDSLASAIRGAVPGAPFAGPATGGKGNYNTWTDPFAKDEASMLVLVTQHYYRSAGAEATSTLSQLLAPDPGLVTMLQTVSAASAANQIRDGYRLGETNSYSGHGKAGVSDTLGSALWVVDFLFINALNGATGVNFHGGGAGQQGPTPFVYSPIAEANGVVTAAQPLFYGMLLFTRAGTGDLLATTAKAGSLEFTAYALAPADGSTSVVLVNKDPTSAVTASVDLGQSVAGASAVLLQGGTLDSTSGVTLAGSGISASGDWSPAPPWALPVSGSVVTVVVPPASAALVHAL
jgi:hypothetical protein